MTETADKPIRLKVISPEDILVDTMVENVTLPGTMGPFVVLRNHAPLISSLTRGSIRYSLDGETLSCPLSSGFVEVKDNQVLACIER